MTMIVLVFAGTTEGRIISEAIATSGTKVHVCVATDYGKELYRNIDGLTVTAERLDSDGMVSLIRRLPAEAVVDATHPYAVAVTKNIVEACSKTGTRYLRILRSEGNMSNDPRIIRVSDVASAVEYLKNTTGKIFVATGSKELRKFTEIEGYRDRLFVRVLSLPGVVAECAEMGFVGSNICCMQGPFSTDLNYAMLKQTGATYMVTKDSGGPGGFDEKIVAAKRAGVKVVLIGRPPEEDGLTLDEAVSQLSELTGRMVHIDIDRTIAIGKRLVMVVGIGMGSDGTITERAKEACSVADVLIGAERMLDSVDRSGKDAFAEYRANKIIEFLDDNDCYRSAAVLLSGDVGFFSGAKSLLDSIDRGRYDIEVIPGLPSVAYLCSKLSIPWQDVRLVSAHGRRCNIVGEIRRNASVFSLFDNGDAVRSLCMDLIEYDLPDVKVHVGTDLSYDSEKILVGTPDEISEMDFEGLCVALIRNPDADRVRPVSLDDDDFIRGDAPMTKSEIRSLSVMKMKLYDGAVVYDIGAGTGSVSVEMALNAPSSMVYAIEKDTKAIALIEANMKKHSAANVKIVEGTAPTALTGLEAPTHAFIGGSSGNLKSIMLALVEANPDVRIVVNSVTLETVGEVMSCIKDLDLIDGGTSCISVARSRNAGDHHLMISQNPVYITVCSGAGR